MCPPLISISQPYRKTHTCITVALYTLDISAKFQPWRHIQLKTTFIHNNSTNYPLPDLKHISSHYCFGYYKHTLCHISGQNNTQDQYWGITFMSIIHAGPHVLWHCCLALEGSFMCLSLGCLKGEKNREVTYIQKYM